MHRQPTRGSRHHLVRRPQRIDGVPGYCEKAAENSYSKDLIWGSAKIDWNDAIARGVAHKGDLNPPKGALVFWDLAAPYGHVGVARGDGYFWATSVNGKIGPGEAPLLLQLPRLGVAEVLTTTDREHPDARSAPHASGCSTLSSQSATNAR